MLKGDIHGGPAVWGYIFSNGIPSYLFRHMAYLGNVALLNHCYSLKSVSEKGLLKSKQGIDKLTSFLIAD